VGLRRVPASLWCIRRLPSSQRRVGIAGEVPESGIDTVVANHKSCRAWGLSPAAHSRTLALMVAKLPQRRRIRLNKAMYSEQDIVFSITVCVRDREPIFARAPLAVAAVRVLSEPAEQVAAPVYAWCIVPNHVHLVMSAAPTCDVVTLVGRFKSLTMRAAWQLGVPGSFWRHGTRRRGTSPRPTRTSVQRRRSLQAPRFRNHARA